MDEIITRPTTNEGLQVKRSTLSIF